MVKAARRRGYRYLAITDHSKRVTIAHGLDAKRLARQIDEIGRINETLADFTVLAGVEVDILTDGSFDLPDSILQRLDLVVGAVHSGFDLARDRQTDRLIRAMDNRHLSLIAHPTGRLLNERAPLELDIERLFAAAHERGCGLEINGQPDRLDLTDWQAKLARDMSVKLAVSTDAHSAAELDFMR